MYNEKNIVSDPIGHEHGHGHHHHYCSRKTISWSAIVSGALTGVGLSFLLNLFGLAISLSGLNANTTTGSLSFAIGGFIGLIIAAIAAMFVAGWVAGYLSRRLHHYNRYLGVLYGFLAWCLALILIIGLAGPASNFIAASYNAVGNPRYALTSVTTNPNQPIVSQQTNTTTATQTTVNAPKTLTLSLFLTFLLFFIGALASCFGGYCGYGHRETVEEHIPIK